MPPPQSKPLKTAKQALGPKIRTRGTPAALPRLFLANAALLQTQVIKTGKPFSDGFLLGEGETFGPALCPSPRAHALRLGGGEADSVYLGCVRVVQVFWSGCDFCWESGVYMNGKWSGKQQTFQNSVKRMEGQLKIENSLCLLEDEMEEGRNVGCWSIQQNLLYAIFIDHNKMIMISKKKRKKCRIFDQMSNFIATRNSLQCRSHHQKLIEKLGEIKAIILAFKKYFGKQYYRQQYNIHTNKHTKKELPSIASIKSEHNPALEYSPSPNSQDSSPHHRSEPAAEAGASEGVAPGAEHETGASACKAESGIQYYFPYNYYIGNSILQFPFAASYFALQPIVPN